MTYRERRGRFVALACFLAAAPAAAEDAKPKLGWSGEGELGYTQTSGNTDTTSLSAKLGVRHQRESWLNALKLEATNKSDQDVTTAERYYGAGKSDYAMTQRDYVFGTADYEKDRFSGYAHRTNLGLGYGRKLMDSDELKLRAEIGPGYRWSQLDSGDEEDEWTARIAGDLAWKISETAGFTEELVIVTGDSDTATRSLSALTAKINGNFSLRLSYLYNHHSDVPDGKDQADTETAVTLVYGF